MTFNPTHYLEASQERIKTAYKLQKDARFVAAIYLAGLAVECLLRAYRTRRNPQFDARHDLGDLLKASGIADFIPEKRRKELAIHFGEVWSRWKNDYRFASESRLKSRFKELHLDRGVKGDSLKHNASVVVNSAFAIINIGVPRWNSKMN